MSILCLFLFLTFSLTFLSLVTCFPCILPVYQGAPNAFLINLISYLSKKKKKRKRTRKSIKLSDSEDKFFS
jgi:hypothetical protein